MQQEVLSLPAVRQYRICMRLLGVAYGIAGFLFFFFPQFIFYLVNFVPEQFQLLGLMPASAELFWLPLATSMMMMLVVLAFGAAAQPENRLLAVVHMVSKCCSSMGYLYFFLTKEQYFAYLVGVITDFPIFLFVGWLSWRCWRAIDDGKETSS